MKHIKSIVIELIHRHGTNNPFDIASQKNITVLFENLGETYGFFSTYKRSLFIHIHNGITEVSQRFVCSHELAHAVLHPDVNTPFLNKHTFYSIDRIECEANKFAVELLMPDELLYENKCANYTIQEAAATYGVPYELAYLKKII